MLNNHNRNNSNSHSRSHNEGDEVGEVVVVGVVATMELQIRMSPMRRQRYPWYQDQYKRPRIELQEEGEGGGTFAEGHRTLGFRNVSLLGVASLGVN